jgi:hypothetical protein
LGSVQVNELSQSSAEVHVNTADKGFSPLTTQPSFFNLTAPCSLFARQSHVMVWHGSIGLEWTV